MKPFVWVAKLEGKIHIECLSDVCYNVHLSPSLDTRNHVVGHYSNGGFRKPILDQVTTMKRRCVLYGYQTHLALHSVFG